MDNACRQRAQRPEGRSQTLAHPAQGIQHGHFPNIVLGRGQHALSREHHPLRPETVMPFESFDRSRQTLAVDRDRNYWSKKHHVIRVQRSLPHKPQRFLICCDRMDEIVLGNVPVHIIQRLKICSGMRWRPHGQGKSVADGIEGLAGFLQRVAAHNQAMIHEHKDTGVRLPGHGFFNGKGQRQSRTHRGNKHMPEGNKPLCKCPFSIAMRTKSETLHTVHMNHKAVRQQCMHACFNGRAQAGGIRKIMKIFITQAVTAHNFFSGYSDERVFSGCVFQPQT